MSGVAAVVGNPRPGSRTRGAAEALGRAASGGGEVPVVDLAALGPALLAPGDPAVLEAARTVGTAAVVVVATPAYRGSFTGLLKLFLDGLPPGALEGALAVPLVVAGSPGHLRTADAHLRLVLAELGADLPGASLLVQERDLPDLPTRAAAWVAGHAAALPAAPAPTLEVPS
ncbi:NADPH-dependent FMN reductase [Vallicoccus soli]|uniref:NADPH-dependent oxidoreductase n=1 Tax=Vallicoccus soli TaxID=2339232 RepID=A0A3A3ZIT8_9ACTN|nr:NAD(P)H-dependent oxidoreductase [Vallicoccus soli]RJK95456.1 NADPH-dependent oxidoreductase [Vallicoccus soli]